MTHSGKKPVRVLYSFPNKIGAADADLLYGLAADELGLAAAGAEVTVIAGGVFRPT